MAVRNDNGKASLRCYKLTNMNNSSSLKYEKTVESLDLLHANTMVYCKPLGGIVIATDDKNCTKIKLVNTTTFHVDSIESKMKNSSIGYSEKLGLVIKKKGTDSIYRYKIDKKNRTITRINKDLKIKKPKKMKNEQLDAQGIYVIGNKIYAFWDLVNTKKDYRPSENIKRYSANIIQKYEVNPKSNKISLIKEYKVSLDCEFEGMCYSSSNNECYFSANVNYGKRALHIYKTSGETLGLKK